MTRCEWSGAVLSRKPISLLGNATARRAIGAGARPVEQTLENAGHMPYPGPDGAAETGGVPEGNPTDTKLRAVLEYLSGKAPDVPAPARGYPTRADVVAWSREFIRAGETGLRGRAAPAYTGRNEDLGARNAALKRRLRTVRADARRWKESAGGILGPSRTSRRSVRKRRCRSRGSVFS